MEQEKDCLLYQKMYNADCKSALSIVRHALRNMSNSASTKALAQQDTKGQHLLFGGTDALTGNVNAQATAYGAAKQLFLQLFPRRVSPRTLRHNDLILPKICSFIP